MLGDTSIELSLGRKMSFASDASSGVAFLHAMDPPGIHRDLKSGNLLVDADWVVKVSDFG